ncbi:MAG: WHG domain-containing protein [Chloroflexota bacterium]
MARDLTKEKVVQTAADLVNAAGDFNQITLKQVADACGVKVPSLYNHVKGLDGLHQSLRLHSIRLLERYIRDGLMGLSGREALVSAANSYRQFAHDQPGIYHLGISAVGMDAETKQASQDVTGLLVLAFGSYGLTGEDAYHVLRGYRSVVHGFVSIELVAGFGLPYDPDVSFKLLVETFLNGVES